MGCVGSRKEVVLGSIPSIKKSSLIPKNSISNNQFILKVLTNDKNILLHIDKCNDYIQITELLNFACFVSPFSSTLDANFICRRKDKDFVYHIQRIAGKEIENEENPSIGKQWFVYINDIKYDWDFLCSNNRIVQKSDIIELKFEK